MRRKQLEEEEQISELRKENYVLSMAYHRAVSALVNQTAIVANNEKSRKRGQFPFIQNGNYSSIIRFLIWLQRDHALTEHTEDRTFLDVGAGIGNVITVASVMGFRSTGVEYRKDYKPISDTAMWYGSAERFKKYHEFDIVYFFQPMFDREKQTSLERKVLKLMKQGAYIVTPYLTMLTNDSIGQSNRKWLTTNFKQLYPPQCGALFIAQKKGNNIPVEQGG